MSMAGERRGRLLRRQLELLALLRSCGWVTLRWLAEQTGVCQRTIRRDLAALEEAHFPVTKIDHGHDDGVPRWKLMTGAPCPLCGKATMKGAELRRELETVRIS
jgi:predicted DNA-binding transcriptional regulator YafY